MSGKVVVQTVVVSQLGGFVKTLTSEMVDSLQDAFVWLDFFGIPQAKDRLVDDASSDAPPDGMQDVIESLPSYAQSSHMFLVLAPQCQLADGSDFCNFGTWLLRGWCNVEFFCSSVAQSPQVQV